MTSFDLFLKSIIKKIMDPNVPIINETGTSKRDIIILESISANNNIPIPNKVTKGRFVLKLSPEILETIFGTIRPKNGIFPITEETIPIVKEISIVAIKMIF